MSVQSIAKVLLAALESPLAVVAIHRICTEKGVEFDFNAVHAEATKLAEMPEEQLAMCGVRDCRGGGDAENG